MQNTITVKNWNGEILEQYNTASHADAISFGQDEAYVLGDNGTVEVIALCENGFLVFVYGYDSLQGEVLLLDTREEINTCKSRVKPAFHVRKARVHSQAFIYSKPIAKPIGYVMPSYAHVPVNVAQYIQMTEHKNAPKRKNLRF